MTSRFTWDPAKASSNRVKHGVSFELAAAALDDPLLLSLYQVVDGEERWVSLGRPPGAAHLVLLIVHADLECGIRIISARKATVHERKAYETG